MTEDITGKRIAFLLTDGVEEVELTSPWQAVKDAGGIPVLVSPKPDTVTANNHDTEAGGSYPVDVRVSIANAEEYDSLVLPGGVVNADSLRTDKDSVAFTKAFFEAGKPVAAICHAAWILIEAAVVEGRELTSYPSLATDLRNAGARWVDEEVVVDNGLTTSRSPADLPAFNAKLVEETWEGKHSGQTA
ncbi:type 1 glutamine amidotransferase domain-containing protein [Saxibacter everestensis]|uniref:Type 1 glutamine amidotransferase domain-containing protein n=1 Tax=Saxibacter everestensis TaxID=2909229 RepID=A0ABY8QQF0_9MICO|nr:type 1 glutamine amidotransferase domain-containing protein [Brevibacteriaceae bacterium ZFBP1038]